jgi:membrane protein implicated in regulation of membrane protease activity
MIEFLASMTEWHWLILGIVLVVAEIAAPGTFLLWPGLAAIIVGLLNAIIPSLPWTYSIVIWAILSVLTIVGFLFYRKKNPSNIISNTLNQRGSQYIGERYTLDKPIINGKGDMRVGDSVWKVVCTQDLPAGSVVIVTALEGTSLRVVLSERN